MSLNYYTNERNVQIIISLLKANGIKRIIASPGTTNMTFVVSVQNDPWFEVYSFVDERSAAYIACETTSDFENRHSIYIEKVNIKFIKPQTGASFERIKNCSLGLYYGG